MWNVAYSKRLSGRVFPRHVLGLGIVTSIIPAEAPLCYVWEPVQAPLWSRSHIGCPEKGWKRQGLFSGLSRPSAIVMSPVPLYSFCFCFVDMVEEEMTLLFAFFSGKCYNAVLLPLLGPFLP